MANGSVRAKVNVVHFVSPEMGGMERSAEIKERDLVDERRVLTSGVEESEPFVDLRVRTCYSFNNAAHTLLVAPAHTITCFCIRDFRIAITDSCGYV